MNTFDEQAQSHFDQFGYVILDGILSDNEVSYIRNTVQTIAEWERAQGQAALYGNNKHQRIWNILNKHQVFRDTILKPVILEAMKRVMGEDIIISSWTVNIIGSGGNEEGLHIDSHVPEPVPAFPVKVNSIWMLDDFTEDNGATQILPGSHRFLRHPRKEDQSRADLVKLIAPKGSVALIHGALWHRSGANLTKRDRISMLGSFCPAFMRPQEDHLQIMDKGIIEGMTPRLQHLIGVGYGINAGATLQPPKDIFL